MLSTLCCCCCVVYDARNNGGWERLLYVTKRRWHLCTCKHKGKAKNFCKLENVGSASHVEAWQAVLVMLSGVVVAIY
jgi:hypothetical protein